MKKFSSVLSPSGYEREIQNAILDYFSEKGVAAELDTIGNVLFKKQGNSDKTLMLVAHCDEIGFSVKYIDDSGYIYFTPIGGVDMSLLRGQCVSILHGCTTVNGVVGTKPVHLSRSGKGGDTSIGDLWIDIGAFEKQEAENLVSIGDPITFSPNFIELENGLFASKSVDNRSGITALMQIYEQVKDAELDYNIVFVASVQEEIGLRGAVIAGYSVNPDVCIAIDVTHATDYPTMDKKKFGDVRLGGGAVIPLGANFSPQLQNELKKIAVSRGHKYQVESSPMFSGTDIAAVQLVKEGCKTGLISIPCRYMHSPLEIASYKDIEIVVDIIVSFCLNAFIKEI